MSWSGARRFVSPIQFPLPANSTSTTCVPTGSDEVLKVATPLTSDTGDEDPPTLKTAMPAGVAALGGTGAAANVKVTCWPGDAGLADDVRVAAVFARVIARVPFTNWIV